MESPRFKIIDDDRTLKYKNIFAKDQLPIQSEDVFVVKKVKNTVSQKNNTKIFEIDSKITTDHDYDNFIC